MANNDGTDAASSVPPPSRRPATSTLAPPRRVHRRWPWVVAGIVAVAVLAGVGADLAVAWLAYRHSTQQIAAVEATVTQVRRSPSPANVVALGQDAAALGTDLQQLDRATAPPLVTPLLDHLPWLGPRYLAGRELIAMGEDLAGAGQTLAPVGATVLGSLHQGAVLGGSASAPSWLDVLVHQGPALRRAAAEVDAAAAIRNRLDPRLLPASLQPRLTRLDALLGNPQVQTVLHTDLPTVESALGAQHPVRYLVLFQDPQELRPAGGFAGEVALVTLDHGRLADVQFSESTPLSNAYNTRRPSLVPLPWPIQHFFPQLGFQIQDATWFADFPKSGAEFMSMYAVTGWPPIDGVVAIQPSIVQDVLRVLGSVPIQVDGKTEVITAANYFNMIELPEHLRRAGITVGVTHKDVINLLGHAMLAQLKRASASQMLAIGRDAVAEAGRRDIQLYSGNPRVEQLLDRYGWSGRLDPRPGVPTLAVTFANVAINKASLAMQPRYTLKLGPAVNGRRAASLSIDVTNTGLNTQDPAFYGFQKWWIELALPAGSHVVSSSPAPLADPEAPNGGGYEIDVFPQQVRSLIVTFTMPAADSLLIRRQPGLNTVPLTVTEGACPTSRPAMLTNDLTLDLAGPCRR